MNPELIKRSFDLAVAILIYFFLSPVIIFTAVLIHLCMGTPVFFCQTRPGLHGKPFIIYKFRTMKNELDEKGGLIEDSKRLTVIGRFLRQTSLDELPELFNVLKGDMSLVGPRPLLMQYLDRYSPEQNRRHEVKPGITGWAQVNGRNAITWKQKFEYDVWYVDNQALRLDLKILGMTIRTIFRREGISQPGRATVDEFNPQITPISADRSTDCAD